MGCPSVSFGLEFLGTLPKLEEIPALTKQVHLAVAFGESLVASRGAVLHELAIFPHQHPIDVHAICQLVPEFIPAVPGIFGDVVADSNRPQLILEDFSDHLSRHGHDLDLDLVRYFRAGESEDKAHRCTE